MKNIVPKEAFQQLRDYQKTAVEKAITFIEKASKNPRKNGLISMPTGSGKTAIMAVITRCYSNITGTVLIVSPRHAISKQIAKELGPADEKDNAGNKVNYESLFFNKKMGLTQSIPNTVIFLQDQIPKAPASGHNVIVTTIQKIDYLASNEEAQYNDLISQVTLIVFDEGHYEPAISWSKTIRKFKCPRLIFTATPFRNDFKSFNIDWQSAHFVTYHEIKTAGYLRGVKFQKKEKPGSVKEFVQQVINDYKANFGDLDPKRKIIINCSSSSSILEISRELNEQKIDFIAIHDTFQKPDTLYLNISSKLKYRVPTHPEKESAVVWVHQYKLLEGVDDPSFQMLAIYEPLRNSRALIQQVGRIIRNPKKKREKALAIDYTDGDLQSDWSDYLALDKEGKLQRGFSQIVLDRFDSVLDPKLYVERKFRSKFDPDDFDGLDFDKLSETIQVPLKVNLLHKLPKFKLQDVAADLIEAEFANSDKIHYKNVFQDQKTIVYIYFAITNSKYLAEEYYPQISQEICIISEHGDIIAFYDSTDFNIIGEDDHGVGLGIDPVLLQRIISQKFNSNFTRVGLKNGNIGSNDIRSHSFTAASLAEATPLLNDFAHFLSSIFGTYDEQRPFLAEDGDKIVKSYLGFTTGRISQHDSTFVSIKEYLEWIKYLIRIINDSNRDVDLLFTRYAAQLSTITSADKDPKSILIDIYSIENDAEDNESVKWKERAPDRCLEVAQNTAGKPGFSLALDEFVLQFTLSFVEETAKFRIELTKVLDNTGASAQPDKPTAKLIEQLVATLNRKQAFRIIADSGNLYSNGYFYRPRLPYGSNFNENLFPLSGTIIDDTVLAMIQSEKGITGLPNDAGWQGDSIFGLIDQQGAYQNLVTKISTHLSNLDMMVCTDLRTEAADFILISGRKLIFVHVKGLGNDPATPAKLYGATGITDVCDQVIKNVHYISMFDDLVPKNINDWDKEYSVTNAKLNINVKVSSRLRIWKASRQHNGITAQQIWDEIKPLKYNAGTEKEVWIVLGKLLSRKSLFDQLKKDKPAAEAVQSLVTLQNTLASVGSMGARLRVFCSP